MISVLLSDGEQVDVDLADDTVVDRADDAVVDILVHANGSARDLERDLTNEAAALGLAVRGFGAAPRRIRITSR